MILWFKAAVDRALARIRKKTVRKSGSYDAPLAKELAGIGVRLEHVTKALSESKLENKAPSDWKEEDARLFAEKIRSISKPTIIIANKMDLSQAERNFEHLREEFKSQLVIPVCSEAELALRRAEEKKLIQYVPGEETFKVIDESRLSKDQAWA